MGHLLLNGSSTLGNVGQTFDNVAGFITTHEVANRVLHPQALSTASPIAASAWNLNDYGIDAESFINFIDQEGFNLSGNTNLSTFSAVNFSPGNFNKSYLNQLMGSHGSLLPDKHGVQTFLHEVGHIASNKSGANLTNSKLDSFNAAVNAPNRNLSHITTNYLDLMRERALEEARAETFSYHTLSRTTVGQEYLQHLRSVDLTQDVTERAMRFNTFTGTLYYHFNDRFSYGFEYYADLGTDHRTVLSGLGANVDDLTIRAQIVGTGTILGATDFGDYGEAFDPVRERLIERNREYILNNYGQSHLDEFDEALRFGRENKIGMVGVSQNVVSGGVIAPPPTPSASTDSPPARVTSNTPVSQRRLDALEEMAANGSDAEKEIARKKLEELRRSGRVPTTGPVDPGRPTISVGSTADIRTTPSPKGTDAAAPRAGAAAKAADATAKVTTDAPKVVPAVSPSSGAPRRGKSLVDNAAETARNIARGHGNARTMGIIGAATLLGIGVASNRSKKTIERDQGTYLDESRRRMGN